MIKRVDEKQELIYRVPTQYPYRASFSTKNNKQLAMDPPPNSDDNTTIGPKMSIEKSAKREIKLVTHTHRGNNKH